MPPVIKNLTNFGANYQHYTKTTLTFISIMKIKQYLSFCLLAALVMTSLQAGGNNIDVTSARATANTFLKQQTASSRSFRTVAAADLKLAHAESSSAVANVNDYYAFNINGGGFVIVAGEDRANPILGFSDRGHLDFNNLPENFKALMCGYKEEIEFLQTHPEYKVPAIDRSSNGPGVAPLVKSTWGQEEPYDWQCPVYQGQYCVVGCVATAMAQVMYYWKYPTSCSSISSYYCYEIGQTIPALPATTFNYSLILPSYCHWDYDLSELIQDTYTDEQAQEVAKLSRYCGQAVDMSYSPEGSGAYTWTQLSAMKDFGYSSDARDVERNSWWGTSYTTAEWEAMIKEELDKGRPILYSANDPNAGGHAFICDGYNAEGMFHFNMGWYGTCDGWYLSTALNMTHRDGEQLKFNSSHEMLLGVVPPSYCIISADGIIAPNDLLVLGDDLSIQANNVRILTSNEALNMTFTVNNSSGKQMASSPAVNITTAEFEQGSSISSAITLPTTLEQGVYHLQFNYIPLNSGRTTAIDCESGELNVVGHLAKYNAPFTIEDVTQTIDYLLMGTYPNLKIDDVTSLIDVLLSSH